MEMDQSPVDEKAVTQICEMGYDRSLAEKALRETKGVEAALEWLVNHGDEAAQDSSVKAKSIRCVDTGKLFRTMADAMIYAERTGNTNFEETDLEIPPLTEEEKAERTKKVKEMIKNKVAQREEQEKQDSLERERNRRSGGREMGKIREEQELLQRKRDAEAREKEKIRFEAEARKLKEEVAKDKAERAMEKAVRLRSGDPKEAWEKAFKMAMGGDGPTEKTPVERADQCLHVIESFRLGNKGLDCIKTVKKMLQNIETNPGEAKFKRVNLGNEAFKNKVGGVQGGLALLKAAGFEDCIGDAGEKSLSLAADASMERLSAVLERVKVSEAKMSSSG